MLTAIDAVGRGQPLCLLARTLCHDAGCKIVHGSDQNSRMTGPWRREITQHMAMIKRRCLEGV
jgi:hypothetical protein